MIGLLSAPAAMRVPSDAPAAVRLPKAVGWKLARYCFGTSAEAAAAYWAALRRGLFWRAIFSACWSVSSSGGCGAAPCGAAAVGVACPGSSASAAGTRRMAATKTDRRGISARLLKPLRITVAVHQIVRRRDQKNGQNHRKRQSAYDRASERRVRLAPFAQFHGHGQQADDCGERCHEHGAQAHAARARHGLSHAQAFGAEMTRELDDQNAV